MTDPLAGLRQQYHFMPDDHGRMAWDVYKLIEAADLRFPIILGADGRVMDGMHRVGKALIAEHRTISARRFVDEPAPDHRNCSAKDLDYTGR